MGKNFAVQADTGSFEPFGQAAVRHAVRACGGVETLDPKITEGALAGFAVAIGPILRLHDRVFGVTKKFRASAAVALRLFQHSFPARTACRGICSSWHCCLPRECARGSSFSELLFRYRSFQPRSLIHPADAG